MRVKRALKILAGVFGVLALTGMAGCHRWGNLSPEEKAAKISERVSDKLDFTEAQKEKLTGIANDIAAELKGAKADRDADRAFVLAQIESDRLDEAALLQLWNKRRDKLDEVLPKYLGRIAELHATMTPEQKARIAEFIKERADRHHRD